ncbi:hypothetical protein EW145_g6982 [Phellinidium pouzarii]|uniref:Uncharacterized protein n=1 Tax=Phellinidium pouzarii TaxID=167371 RepID=A0A4S4KR34_9AGAM|nr:hypothetical protein EW145_g6982 [Phellinidium pouzarii]
MAGDSLIVHNFVLSSSKSVESASLSPEKLLVQGRNLVASTQAREGWSTVVLPRAPTSNFANSTGRILVLRNAISSGTAFQTVCKQPPLNPIKRWGHLDADAEVTDVSNLKEFEGTDLSYLYKRKKITEKYPPQHQRTKKRSREAFDEGQCVDVHRVKKRRRVECTHLHDLIPQPHHHSHPTFATGNCLDSEIIRRFPPYSKAPFVCIVPYSRKAAATYFKDVYARSAWVIPVKGKLPWKDASQAQLEDSLTSVSLMTSGVLGVPIRWTAVLIGKFWDDLLEIRKRHVLGAISISYHVGSREELQEQITKTTFTTRIKEPLPVDPPTPTHLSQCTYIKIYHDVRYALYVRSVLDVWKTEVEVEDASVVSDAASSASHSRTTTKPVSQTIKQTNAEFSPCCAPCVLDSPRFNRSLPMPLSSHLRHRDDVCLDLSIL